MTITELYRKSTDMLKGAGVESPAFDAFCIISHITGITRTQLISEPDTTVSDKDSAEIATLLNRRVTGKPLQYLLGKWEFCSREFFVGEGVLIPRCDTEVVLGCAREFLKKLESPAVCDLCAGSGVLALTIKLMYPCADVTAVELSESAFGYLLKNAGHLGADINAVCADVFTCSHLFSDRSFDLIISNPPYLRTDELTNMQRELVFEPSMALDGGEDGCNFYRGIISGFRSKLRPGGMLAFELDPGQVPYVAALMDEAGFTGIAVHDDIGGAHRAISGTVFEK